MRRLHPPEPNLVGLRNMEDATKSKGCRVFEKIALQGTILVRFCSANNFFQRDEITKQEKQRFLLQVIR